MYYVDALAVKQACRRRTGRLSRRTGDRLLESPVDGVLKGRRFDSEEAQGIVEGIPFPHILHEDGGLFTETVDEHVRGDQALLVRRYRGSSAHA